MIGLIKKDLIVMARRTNPLQMLIILVVIIPLSQNPQFILIGLSMVFSFLFSILLTSSFSYDEASKWNEYVVVLPLSPKKVVGAKYVIVIASMIVSLAIILLVFSVCRAYGLAGIADLQMVIVLSLLFSCTFNAVQIPFIYRFGVEISRTLLYVVILIPSLIVSLLAMLKIKVDLSLIIREKWHPLLVVVQLTLLYLSYLLSVKIYSQNKKNVFYK